MVSYTKKRVCIRRQIDADDLRLLVYDMVNKTRVLVTEPVMVLPPDMGCEEVGE